MNTLLFDIDGTLIRTGGAGCHAMQVALKSLFGLDTSPNLDVHGRTDRGIVNELFELNLLDSDQHFDSFSQHYWEHLPNSLSEVPGEVLPSVFDLLEQLQTLPQFSLGILTGNAKRAAEIKLQHFQLESYFSFGGYGDHHACRNEVARMAHSAAANHLGERFDPGSVWVIGDTVNDITCARSIGAKVIAVETGGGTPEALAAAEPDAQFNTLDTDAFMALFA